jgi:hypothetical protein
MCILIYKHGVPPGENYACVGHWSFIVPTAVPVRYTPPRERGEASEKGKGKELEASRQLVEDSELRATAFTNYGYGGAAIELRLDRPGLGGAKREAKTVAEQKELIITKDRFLRIYSTELN